MSNVFSKIAEYVSDETRQAHEDAHSQLVALRGSSRNTTPRNLTDIQNDDPPLNFSPLEVFQSPAITEDIDPASDVRIGWTKLQVPPQDISIDEVRYNKEISSLRARGNALIKTGRGHIRIGLPMEFADDDAVNSDLRTLIAQFRTCPITTVENDQISTAVLLRRADQKAAEAYQGAKTTKQAADQKYLSTKGKLIEYLARFSDVFPRALGKTTDEALEDFHDMRAAELEQQLNTIAAFYASDRETWGDDLSYSTANTFSDLQDAREKLDLMKKTWGEVLDASRQYVQTAIDFSYSYPSVPIILHQLTCQTVPGFPERIQGNLEAFYFNVEPFMPVMQFAGPMLNPTPDITECSVYWDHLQKYLEPEMRHDITHRVSSCALGEVGSRTRGLLKFSYPLAEVERVERDAVSISGSEAYTVPPPGGEEEDDFIYRLKHKDFIINGDNKNIILSSVAVSLENTLAPQPIEGHMYGTFQYMGQMNAKIRLVFTVTGNTSTEHLQALQNLHEIKKQTELVATKFGEKARRNARITLEHDLVRLFGVHTVLIDRIHTKTAGINTSTVTIDFTEYTTSQEKREQLLMSVISTKDRIQEHVLSFLADVCGAEIHNIGSDDAMELVQSSTTNAGSWCVDTLYGSVIGARSGEDTGGILTADVLAEVLGRLPGVRDRLKKELMPTPTEVLKAPPKSRSILASSPGREWQGGLIGVGGFSFESAVEVQQEREPAGHVGGLAPGISEIVQQAIHRDDPKEEDQTEITRQVDTRLHELAIEHLEYWGRRVLSGPGGVSSHDAWGTDETKTKMDSYGLFEIPPVPTSDMIKDILSVFDTNRYRFRTERERLLAAVEQSQLLFSSIREEIQSIRETAQLNSPYPDLDLPDYATAYKRLWATIKTRTGYDVLDYPDMRGLPPRIKNLVRLALPTYEDLGIRPPFGKSRTDIARRLTDQVDPDFYFHWRRVKTDPFMTEAARQAMTAIRSIKTTKAEVVSSGQEMERARLKTQVYSVLSKGSAKPTNKYADSPAPSDTKPPVGKWHVVKEEDGAPTPAPALNGGGVGDKFMYATVHKDSQKLMKDINPDDEYHRRRLFQAALDNVPDRFQRLITVFPTFKLYLIESDAEEWSLWDDFYGYNAVKSIRIHHHKYSPDIAEIEIVNVTGNLDEARGLSSDQARSSHEKKDRETKEAREADTGEVEKLDNFFLEAGTPIMVRLGYSSKEDELEVRFTGQIVSIDSGDITKVVAQSYSSELTTPVSKLIDGRNSFAIMHEIMKSCPTIHYGEWAALEYGGRNPYTGEVLGSQDGTSLEKDIIGQSASISERRRSITGQLGEAFGMLISTPQQILGDIMADRKTMNVYLPIEHNWRHMQSEGSGEPWGIPNVTGLEAIHELSRHIPGHVFGSRPYDHRATLFFGKPEQPYFYTDGKKDEEVSWQEAKARADIQAETKIGDLLTQFFSSAGGEMLQALVSMFKGGQISLAGRIARQFGKSVALAPRYLTFGGFNVIERLLGWDIVEGAADLMYNDEAWRQEEISPVTSELRSVEGMVGREGLHFLTGLFFMRYNDKMSPGKMTTSTLASALEDIRYMNYLGAVGHLFSGGGELIAEARGYGIPPAGLTLYFYEGWREAVEAISQQTGGSENAVERVRAAAFSDLNGTGPVRAINGESIDREHYNSMVRSVINWIPIWKCFILLFNQFLQTQVNQDILNAAYNASREVEELDLNPRMKRFRNHHFAHSELDIIKNGIMATQEFMANRVIIDYPRKQSFKEYGDNLVVYTRPQKGATYELGFDDDIQGADIRVRVVTEPNAVTKEQAILCARSNLAEALRPMYRGNLLLRGHEKVWPFDVVWVHDVYNGVYGPIEAEAVTDHMDQTGYHVDIVPHALAWAEGGSSYVDNTAAGTWWAFLGVSVASIIAAPVTFGASLWAVPAAAYIAHSRIKGQTGKTLSEDAKNKIVTWIIGQGLYGGADPQVRIMPLVRHGRPWTSGLKGIGEGGWKARLGQRWERIKTGWGLLHNQLRRRLFGS